MPSCFTILVIGSPLIAQQLPAVRRVAVSVFDPTSGIPLPKRGSVSTKSAQLQSTDWIPVIRRLKDGTVRLLKRFCCVRVSGVGEALVAPRCAPTVADDEMLGRVTDETDCVAAVHRGGTMPLQPAVRLSRPLPCVIHDESRQNGTDARDPHPPFIQLRSQTVVGCDTELRRDRIKHVGRECRKRPFIGSMCSGTHPYFCAIRRACFVEVPAGSRNVVGYRVMLSVSLLAIQMNRGDGSSDFWRSLFLT